VYQPQRFPTLNGYSDVGEKTRQWVIAVARETLLSLLIARIRSKETAVPLSTAPGIVPLGPEQMLLEPELVIRGSA
jgi:hypothetical protein